MGCDHFADEDGNFTLEVSNYDGGRVLGRVVLKGLVPYSKLDSDVIVGSSR